jgi:hypothetical protein
MNITPRDKLKEIHQAIVDLEEESRRAVLADRNRDEAVQGGNSSRSKREKQKAHSLSQSIGHVSVLRVVSHSHLAFANHPIPRRHSHRREQFNLKRCGGRKPVSGVFAFTKETSCYRASEQSSFECLTRCAVRACSDFVTEQKSLITDTCAHYSKKVIFGDHLCVSVEKHTLRILTRDVLSGIVFSMHDVRSTEGVSVARKSVSHPFITISGLNSSNSNCCQF